MGRTGKITLIAIAAIAASIFALPSAISEGQIMSKLLLIVMLLIATIVIFILLSK